MNDSLKPYETPAEVEAVVRKFESCIFGPSEFHHRDHLTVALCYLREATEEEAVARLRASLFRFLNHHGIQQEVYHETITIFWLKRVRHFLSQTDSARSLPELANELIRTCCDPQLINLYFSKELLSSAEARQRWVEPDVQPLDF